MSPEISDIEKTSILDKQDYVPEVSRKKLLVLVLLWISNKKNCIQKLANNIIK
ncbi:12310_t:CDS:2 [Dentiscutata heterogama]|uniref:12310_t:CDS:1 n=1 Tax=Dentiscutata heterogama TaxID=1316150 RepID=A0ACA9M897_9GLOM|nr:12310_t:CDS:2 [Dentiscutata heterogama]